MASTKPIKLYGHATGPNPWKVAIILEELGLPYEIESLQFPDMKKEPFLSVNPNGRVPAIDDPNTGVKVWESGAIIDYLIDVYDKEHKLSYTTTPEKYLERSWEHFQMSGQGPYFGQFAWFSFFHSEKGITSAIERYKNEIKRVLGVIDLQLTKSGKPYLVGDKVSYADLMFLPWNNALSRFLGEADLKEWQEKQTKSYEWHQRLVERPAVKAVFAKQAEAIKASSH